MNAHIDDASPGKRLPSGWTAQRLKSILLEPLKYGANEAAVDDDPAQPRFVRITDIAVDGSLRPETFRSIPSEVAQPYMLKEGDLLFARSGATVGKSVMYTASWGPCCFAGYLIRARIDPGKASPQYIRYFSESTLYWQHIASEQIQATIQNVSAERYGNLLVPMPNVAEQSAVVAYLDRETAKIDALIAKQEQLIATLREDRTAIITHAVTKGLNPDVETKDSGVEWLGPVPAHWKVIALKHALSEPITDGPHETPEFLDSGVEFISAEAVSTGEIDFERRRGFISREDHVRYSTKYAPRLYDIYVVKSGATTGISAIVSEQREFNIWSPLAALRCNDEVDPYFLLNFIRSRNFQDAIALNWSYGTQQNIGMGVLGNLRIALPPLPEQRTIVQHIKGRELPIAQLIDKASAGIGTLREYRSALITDAVTGKIDVRGAA